MSIESRLTKIEEKLDASLLAPSSYKLNMSSSREDEIDLRELWGVIWQGKWIIVGIILVFSVISIVYALNLPNIYKAQALLAPSEESRGGGMAALASQFGGLASLAGVSLGGSGSDNTVMALEVMKSRHFINTFIEKYDLLVPLMAAERWDRDSNQLVINPSMYDIHNTQWVREVNTSKSARPSEWEAYKKFMEIFSVSQNKATSLITVQVEHYSPDLAAEWTSSLIKDINSYTREQDVAEATKSIQYLTDKLVSTAVADMRTVFSQMIEEQTKVIMLAEVRDEYVFSTLDAAVVPEDKIKPKRALICILGAIIGGILGAIIVLIRCFNRSSLK